MSMAVETVGLSKAFSGKVAVDRIDLCVQRACMYGFLGPNGAGKSTTIKMLTGLLAPDQGEIRVLGHDLSLQPLEVKCKIGVVPEDLCLFENLTAREYLTFIGRMHGLAPEVLRARSEELLALMELEATGKTLTLEFSHGMKKKLSLAASLIHAPELLFLDEPFEGIDPIASRTLRNVLERFVERGGTVFITSHILEIVERLCTHVGIIHKGRLVRQSSKSDLMANDTLEHAFVEAVGESGKGESALSWLGDSV